MGHLRFYKTFQVGLCAHATLHHPTYHLTLPHTPPNPTKDPHLEEVECSIGLLRHPTSPLQLGHPDHQVLQELQEQEQELADFHQLKQLTTVQEVALCRSSLIIISNLQEDLVPGHLHQQLPVLPPCGRGQGDATL